MSRAGFRQGRNGANCLTARESYEREITKGATSQTARKSQTAPGANSLTAAKPKGAVVVSAFRNVAPGAVCDLRAFSDLCAVRDFAPLGFERRWSFASLRLRASGAPS